MLALYQIYRIEDVPEEWRVSLANETGSEIIGYIVWLVVS